MDIEIISGLVLKPKSGGRFWEVYQPFIVRVDNYIINIPKGYITDFASIRYRIVGIFVPRWGKHGPASVVHDWLYDYPIINRRHADKIFNELMKFYKTKFLTRVMAYYAVKWFGWIAFHPKNK